MPTVRRDHSALALVALLAASLAGACGRDGAGPSEPIARLPRELSIAEREVIAASNAFGFDLFRAVRAADSDARNIFLSPLSVSMALGMTLNGAAGATFEEMRAALRFGSLAQEEINAAYRGLLRLLTGLDPRVELGIANSTWARAGLRFRPSFFQVVRDDFSAEARTLDFALPTAKDTMNAWVRAKTRGRIDAIVDEIRWDDVLFLINAVYFKGSWTTRFDPARTAPGPFRLEDGTTVTVPLMRGEEMSASVGSVDGVLLAELPYGGGAFGMVVALPPEGARLAALIGRLDAVTWDRWIAALRPEGRLYVTLPRFELRYEKVLNGDLQALGMVKAFQPDVADFSRLTPEQVYVSVVKHKSFLKVDEAGTEASAATSVGVGVTSAPPAIRVDRPFLVAIRERLSGTILFLGAIGDPR